MGYGSLNIRFVNRDTHVETSRWTLCSFEGRKTFIPELCHVPQFPKNSSVVMGFVLFCFVYHMKAFLTSVPSLVHQMWLWRPSRCSCSVSERAELGHHWRIWKDVALVIRTTFAFSLTLMGFLCVSSVVLICSFIHFALPVLTSLGSWVLGLSGIKS